MSRPVCAPAAYYMLSTRPGRPWAAFGRAECGCGWWLDTPDASTAQSAAELHAAGIAVLDRRQAAEVLAGRWAA